jgi:hypothetical protein
VTWIRSNYSFIRDHKYRSTEAQLFGHLPYGNADAIRSAIDYAKFRSRSHHAVVRVYDEAGNVIETHEQAGDFKEPSTIELQIKPFQTEVVNESVAPIARRITEVDPRRVALS